MVVMTFLLYLNTLSELFYGIYVFSLTVLGHFNFFRVSVLGTYIF